MAAKFIDTENVSVRIVPRGHIAYITFGGSDVEIRIDRHRQTGEWIVSQDDEWSIRASGHADEVVDALAQLEQS